SVHTAKRLSAWLKENLPPEMRIGENTGLTGRAERYASLDADLVVATSTVDVGVDFRINFLIFESLDAGTFIQRLGRLGRHPGFPAYRAVAVLPPFLVERIQQHLPDASQIDREAFFDLLRDTVFRGHNEFRSYLYRWSGIRSCQRIRKLDKPQYRTHYQDLRQAYQDMARAVFRVGKASWGHLRGLEDNEQEAVLKEVRQFRGAGLWDVWVYDCSTQAVRSLSVPRLVSTTEFTLIKESEAKKLADEAQVSFYPSSLGLYAVIHGYRDQRLPVEVYFDEELINEYERLNEACERFGFQLTARHPLIRQINQELAGQGLCTCVSDKEVETLRRRFALPPLFELYSVRDSAGETYTVAFGQDALLLDAILYWRPTDEVFIV
ncbi:MAG: type I-D CRISPR-associated helicase Cas3', partial [Heliobacteriaceae bacterium]|nr:type I-D CRISPR-associated helicase Cas3' [Heliobacteriaceae bacterium]